MFNGKPVWLRQEDINVELKTCQNLHMFWFLLPLNPYQLSGFTLINILGRVVKSHAVNNSKGCFINHLSCKYFVNLTCQITQMSRGKPQQTKCWDHFAL